MKTNKTTYEYSLAHCQQRAKERFDYDLTIDAYDKFNDNIQLGYLSANDRIEINGDDTQRFYPVLINGKTALLVYSTNLQRIKTILKPE